MVSIDKLAGDKIRKIIEFEDAEGEIQRIEIRNPNKKVKEELFNEVMESEEANNDDYFVLEYLIKELTNVELNKPLKEIDQDEEYVNLAYFEMIKELSSIVAELVREFIFKIDVDIDIDDSKRLLEEKSKR